MENKDNITLSHFDLYCILRFALKHLWMVLMAAAAMFMAVYVMQNQVAKPDYTSDISLAVTSKTAFGTSYTSVAATNTIAEQFSELLDSEVVRNSVCQELGVEKFPAKLAIDVPENTNIINVHVTAATPEVAFRTARAITNNYEEYSSFIFATAVMEVIYGPSIATEPSDLASRQQLLILSAPIGALLMIVLLIFFALRNNTVQTTAGAKDQLDAKLLATIYHQKKKATLRSKLKNIKSSLLINSPTSTFYYAETFHQLRMQLEHARQSRGERVFLITSCTENEGKSTVAANIALSLAQKHEKVLLVDCDLRKPAQYKVFEKKVQQQQDIGYLLSHHMSAEDLMGALQYDESSNLYFLLASSTQRKSAELLTSDETKTLIRSLRANFDFIIIDSPPIGYFVDSEILADLCDASLLVVRQDSVPAPAINDVVDMLTASDSTFLGCILNNVHTIKTISGVVGQSYGRGYGYGYGYGYGKHKKTEVRHD